MSQSNTFKVVPPTIPLMPVTVDFPALALWVQSALLITKYLMSAAATLQNLFTQILLRITVTNLLSRYHRPLALKMLRPCYDSLRRLWLSRCCTNASQLFCKPHEYSKLILQLSESSAVYGCGLVEEALIKKRWTARVEAGWVDSFNVAILHRSYFVLLLYLKYCECPVNW